MRFSARLAHALEGVGHEILGQRPVAHAVGEECEQPGGVTLV